MSEPIFCVLCGAVRKNHLVAFMDSEWFMIWDKPVCRGCVKKVALRFVEDAV